MNAAKRGELMTTRYSLKNIRTLLSDGFTTEELKAFCFDQPELRAVYDRLAAGMGKTEVVHQLLEHADRKELFDLVLAWAQKQNPAKYKKYPPYRATPTISPEKEVENSAALQKDRDQVQESGKDGQAAAYHPCFISYSHQDEAFAERLHADLEQQGVQCWFAPHDMRIGDKIRPTIDGSIQEHDKLLLILSEHSIDSDWVEAEVETAWEKERKLKQAMLFPIRLDDTVMDTDQAWAAHIRRTRHIGDFGRWEDDEVYQKALERLLRDLKI
jgi:hypothetical protein